MKPVDLVVRGIKNSSKTLDIVLDPFGGSGSTLIAAEHTGRQARLIELDPKYVDVIVRRWQEMTGLQATLSGTDQDFKAVEKDRLGGKAKPHCLWRASDASCKALASPSSRSRSMMEPMAAL